jgi:hypothetical protein
MALAADLQLNRLPKRFPVGAAYVIEGLGGEDGKLRVISRYVLLPSGRRINVPATPDAAAASSRAAGRRRPRTAQPKRPAQAKRPPARGKKLAASTGTAHAQRR